MRRKDELMTITKYDRVAFFCQSVAIDVIDCFG